MKFNLEGKIFASMLNTDNGEVGEDTLFHYHQNDSVIWAEYEGGSIVRGHIIGKVIDNGKLDMRYHHINTDGDFMIGACISTPQQLSDGRLKFHEEWQWLSGDQSSGHSESIEIDSV